MIAIRKLVPGLVVLSLGAVAARSIDLLGGPNQLLVAIAIGFVIGNAIDLPERLEPGVGTHSFWLAFGIVLMGASLSLRTVVDVGGLVFLIVVAVAAGTLLFVEVLSRTVFNVTDRLGSLLAAGASICGVSAVVAVAASIEAREEQIAYAAATVLLFDATTLVIYPIVGDVLGLSGIVFGIWAGVSMFSTGPVVAVGFAHSEVAGQWATMTKLSRNALIGVVVLAYATYYARVEARSGSGSGVGEGLSLRLLWTELPTFVVGFLALAILATLGLFSAAQQAAIETTYGWLFLLAFVGLGTEIRIAALRQTGPIPVLVVLVSLLTGSAISLAVLSVVF